MRLPGELLGAMEIALNRSLADAPGVDAELARLAGRTLVVHVRELNLDLVFMPEAGGMRLGDAAVADPGVRLAGSLRDFGRNLFGSGESLGGGIRIEGDAGLAQAFARLLRRAEFDPEDWLAQRLGDVPAELAGRFVREARRAAHRAATTLSLDAAEYLREETRDLIHPEELAAFTAEVEALRARAERLAARVARTRSAGG